MSPTRVGIIGGGMAGPLLAIFLKRAGYAPVIYERVQAHSDAGLGLALQGNGLRVIDKIPGLLEYLGGYQGEEMRQYSLLEEDKGLLGVSDFPKRAKEKDGYGIRAIRRHLVQQRLVEFAKKAGVETFWGHNLETLEQDDDSVTATFANGVKETFSFVVGCDGLHSKTRANLFGEQPATYTGLSQWGGVSPAPEPFRGKAVMAEMSGNGFTLILMSVDDSTVIWALTQREPESKESWKAIDEAAAEEFKKSRFAQLDFGGGEAIRTSTKIIKYGLYDRPELPTWHKGRIVLIGDAAHPTSPHRGQGANQSFEDIEVLMQQLEKYNPSAEPPSTEVLETVFRELEAVRIPQSSESVQKARARGDQRVLEGVEACLARNNRAREAFRSGMFATQGR